MPLLIVHHRCRCLCPCAPFPFLLEAFRPSRSVWHVKPAPGTPPTIYLTFDDGPNPVWTRPLLGALRDQGVHGTFFLIGDHITPETAPIVKRIADEGHAIGLHSGTRAQMVEDPEALVTGRHRRDSRRPPQESPRGTPACR